MCWCCKNLRKVTLRHKNPRLFAGYTSYKRVLPARQLMDFPLICRPAKKWWLFKHFEIHDFVHISLSPQNCRLHCFAGVIYIKLYTFSFHFSDFRCSVRNVERKCAEANICGRWGGLCPWTGFEFSCSIYTIMTIPNVNTHRVAAVGVRTALYFFLLYGEGLWIHGLIWCHRDSKVFHFDSVQCES